MQIKRNTAHWYLPALAGLLLVFSGTVQATTSSFSVLQDAALFVGTGLIVLFLFTRRKIDTKQLSHEK